VCVVCVFVCVCVVCVYVCVCVCICVCGVCVCVYVVCVVCVCGVCVCICVCGVCVVIVCVRASVRASERACPSVCDLETSKRIGLGPIQAVVWQWQMFWLVKRKQDNIIIISSSSATTLGGLWLPQSRTTPLHRDAAEQRQVRMFRSNTKNQRERTKKLRAQ